MRNDKYGVVRQSLSMAFLAGMLTCAATAQTPSQDSSYFEFGRVVALGRGTIDIQTYDQARRRFVQHSFAITRDTRADKVQAGDIVEAIYTPAAGILSLHRLVLLTAGIPVAGPPPPATAQAARSDPKVPATTTAATTPTRGVTLPTTPAAHAPANEVSVNLGRAATTRAPEVINVPLGVGSAASARTAQPKVIARETPSEECNRSALDWPARPLSLAVLDFRYPTEREESHESGTTGGGSGTAVADLVFTRLEQQGEFALTRGDRQKLYRADFAGAARLGRQMGVDAVLAGTFVPIDGPPTADGFPGPRTWELRAGVVDTCTGQLLMRLYSQACSDGAAPGQEANEAQCKRLTVTAKQAMNPEMNVAAFQTPLDVMLYPLEHNITPAEDQGIEGTVTEVNDGRLSLKLAKGARLNVGDELSIHATRLAKNPLTYTLQTLHDQEIGRVSITAVQGNVVSGSFAGEIPARPGDVAVHLAQPPQ